MNPKPQWVDKLADKTERADVDPDYVDNLRAFADALRAGFALPIEWQDRNLSHRITIAEKATKRRDGSGCNERC